MRKLIHISDIHFGKADYAIAERAREKINEIAPDLLIVSGDLTQRARSKQFIEARRFLDSLPGPQIIVPGNHDIPMHNPFARFVTPLEKYKKYITKDLEPFFMDEELAVIGINTARSLTIKDGRINEKQVAAIREKMCALGDKMLKAVVTHHPFDLPEGFDEDDIVDNAETAMPQIKGGNIRAVALTSAKRSPALPDVPTVAESGYKGFEATTWFGVLAPANTPKAVVARLNDEITSVLSLPDVKEKMVDGGGDIKTGPAAFAALLKSDLAKWAAIVKQSGATVD